jgi:hypothetical protein
MFVSCSLHLRFGRPGERRWYIEKAKKVRGRGGKGDISDSIYTEEIKMAP